MSVIPSGASSALSLLRFSLALMVLMQHLATFEPPQTGRLAVEAFFCISGFLITMVATTRYDGRPMAFLANRFLRIYPTYWACLALGFVVVYALPSSVALHPSLLPPASAADWIANLAVFGLTQETISRVLPAAWSLHTELWFYLVIGLLTAARPRLTFILLPVTLVISAYCAFWWAPVEFYGTPLGNADAFFIGSAVFLMRERWRPRHPARVAVIGLFVFQALAWGPIIHSQTTNEFLAAPLIGVFLLGLWNMRLDDALRPVKRAAALLGRLSYPLFLLHWPLGAVVIAATGWEPGLALVLAAGTLSLGVSFLVLRFIEDPLTRIRATIRKADPMPAAPMPAISD